MISHRWTCGVFTSLLFVSLQLAEGGGGSISNKPDLKTDKPKIQMLQSLSLAYSRDPDDEEKRVEIKPVDGTCAVGNFKKEDGKCLVHPLAVAYMEAEESPKGPFDIHVAVSLDEGGTWKRLNLSNNAKRTSTYDGMCFTSQSEDGGDDHRFLQDENTSDEKNYVFPFTGDNGKPMIVAKGNMILVAWNSKNCKGGVPGNQGIGDGPYGGGDDESDPDEVLKEGTGDGENSDEYLVKGHQLCHDYSGEVDFEDGKVPFVPFSCVLAARGRVTSKGDIEWTKPERLTSGRRDATQLVAALASKGMAWAITWQEDPKGLRPGEAAGPGEGMTGATVNHKTDIWYSYIDGDHFKDWDEPDTGSRRFNIKTRFSTPVRVTDNAACKGYFDEDGTLVKKGGSYCAHICGNVDYEPSLKGDKELVCRYKGNLLDGDTGASRVNMFLIADKKPDGMGSARVVLAYEESKGVGKGPGDNHAEDAETQAPADREDWGKNIMYHTFFYDEPDLIAHGEMVNLPELDQSNKPILTADKEAYLTRNARRVRMIQQPPTSVGKENLNMVLLWREGDEGHGHPAHIMMRRMIGGYEPKHMECFKKSKHPETNEEYCVKGTIDLTADNTPAPDAEFDDARAHRGFIRGDMLVLGYIYTNKWGRNAPPRYDFFVRRSFDGGKKFTNAVGQKEGPLNLSNMLQEGNNGFSVMEPRLYATPGTISTSPFVEDIQNSAVWYAAYSTTWKDSDAPKDIYWTMTDNFGESYYQVWNQAANDGEGKWQYPRMAMSHDQGGFAGTQITSNPSGSKLFASFQGDIPTGTSGAGPCAGGGRGSDVCSNTTVLSDPILSRFDLNGDKTVDKYDEKLLKAALEDEESCDDDRFDINGDGFCTGSDLRIFRKGLQEYEKRIPLRRLAADGH